MHSLFNTKSSFTVAMAIVMSLPGREMVVDMVIGVAFSYAGGVRTGKADTDNGINFLWIHWPECSLGNNKGIK